MAAIMMVSLTWWIAFRSVVRMSGDLLVAAHVHPSSLSVLFSSRAVEVIRPRAVRCVAGIFSCRGGKAGTAGAVPARRSLGGDGIAVVVRPCGLLGIGSLRRFRLPSRQPRGFWRPQQRWQPASPGEQLLGGFRHVLLLHVRHPVSRLIAD